MCRDPECPHPDLCECCQEEPALYDYEERTGLDRSGRPYRRREPRLMRLCEGCIDAVAEADEANERELDQVAHSDHEQRVYEEDRDRRMTERMLERAALAAPTPSRITASRPRRADD